MSVAFPGMFAPWLTEVLGGEVPDERLATCADCAMCDRPGEPPRQHATGPSYDPRIKCCTYLPALPNFQVGAILATTGVGAEAHGRATTLARLDAGIAVSPLGIGMTPLYGAMFRRSTQPGATTAFGRAAVLRCPHYVEDGGLCGIWQHRDAVCSTYFCKHDRGPVGARFWDAAKKLLAAAELHLARHCLLELGLSAASLRALPTDFSATEVRGKPELDGEATDGQRRAAWGTWFGRERELYARCAALVAGMTWAEVAAAGGSEVRIAARTCTEAYRDLVQVAAPQVLRAGATAFTLETDGRLRISAGPGNTLLAPAEVLELLPHFDGRPTTVVLAALAVDGVDVDPAFVAKLVDYGVLVAVDP